MKFNFVLFGTILLLIAAPAVAGTPASQPDPLLDGGPVSPCMAGPDYEPGLDVNGRPVVPADAQASRIPMPDEIAVPLHSGQARGPRHGRPGAASPAQPGNSPYVALDGRRLEPLLNPPPCH